MGNNEPAVDQSDLRIRGSYGLNVFIHVYICIRMYDRLSRRRERERKRRLRKQQRNERYAWGGVGRETELGGLLRLWRLNQRKERLA